MVWNHPSLASLLFVRLLVAFEGPVPSERAHLRVSSGLVLIPAVVTSSDYRPVLDLSRDQFRVEVDRHEVPLAAFWKDAGPVSAVLVLDVSGSMASALAKSRQALRGFLDLAYPGDEYALVLCKDRGRVAVPFTSNPDAITAAAFEPEAKGSTPLYDSIHLALEQVKKANHARKAVVIISDGEDTSSRIAFRVLRREVLESNAYVYVLRLWSGCCMSDGIEYESLEELADLTGGVSYGNVPVNDFARYLPELDLHQRYMLAFRPAAAGGDERQHKVRVRLKGVALPRPRLFWRHSFQGSGLD